MHVQLYQAHPIEVSIRNLHILCNSFTKFEKKFAKDYFQKIHAYEKI